MGCTQSNASAGAAVSAKETAKEEPVKKGSPAVAKGKNSPKAKSSPKSPKGSSPVVPKAKAKSSPKAPKPKSSPKRSSGASSGEPKKHKMSENLIIEKSKDFKGDYEVVKQVGEGSISNIYLVKRKKTSLVGICSNSRRAMEDITETECTYDTCVEGSHSDSSDIVTQYALKEIDMELIKPEFVDEMKNEIDLLRKLDHPNILKAYEVYQDGKEHLSIVMELCSGGDLSKRAPCPEAQAQRLVAKIVEAVHYLHKNGIMHRDIKFENIMFENESPDAEPKLIDFGLSKKYTKGKKETDKVGTVYTMAPETIRGDYNQKADMWSVGVVAYELLSGEKPFWGKDRNEIARKVLMAQYDFDGPKWKNISKNAKEFIKKLLQREPKLRYSAEQALKSKWLKPLTQRPSFDLSETNARSMFGSLHESSELKKLALQTVCRKATRAEILELRQLFHTIDVDHDGTISKDEFKKALGSKYDAKEIDEWFELVDADDSGSVSYTEFLSGTCEGKCKLDLERVAVAFQTFDKDDTGFITAENLREILGVSEDSEYLEQLIQEADTNNDGKISFDEFKDTLLGKEKEFIAEVEAVPTAEPSCSC